MGTMFTVPDFVVGLLLGYSFVQWCWNMKLIREDLIWLLRRRYSPDLVRHLENLRPWFVEDGGQHPLPLGRLGSAMQAQDEAGCDEANPENRNK